MVRVCQIETQSFNLILEQEEKILRILLFRPKKYFPGTILGKMRIKENRFFRTSINEINLFSKITSLEIPCEKILEIQQAISECLKWQEFWTKFN